MSIEIANESGVDVDTDAILDVATHALAETGVSPLAELSILLVDTEYMTDLNHRWLGGEGPTDVLAFPLDEANVDHGPGDNGDEPTLLGDIVLCPDVAAQQATKAGHTCADEMALLTVHGTLHLLGYDHAEPEEEREMFGLQDRLLASWRRARAEAEAARARAEAEAAQASGPGASGPWPGEAAADDPDAGSGGSGGTREAHQAG